MEETPWVTITFLLTVVVAAFGYRFFGPEQPQFDEQPIETATEQRVDEKLEEAQEEEVTTEVTTKVAQEPEVKEVEAVEEEESLESSGSEFENINPADVPKVEEISPAESVGAAAVVDQSAVEVEAGFGLEKAIFRLKRRRSKARRKFRLASPCLLISQIWAPFFALLF